VIAFHSGRITQIDRFILSDDPVNLTGDISLGGGPVTVHAGFTDGRYSHDAIHIESRIGAPGQTSLALMASPIISGVWTSQFVGNGIAYCGMSCDSGVDPNLYTQVYRAWPSGAFRGGGLLAVLGSSRPGATPQ
jgi:hypothetical protein